jgi:hypothetical protein
MAVLETEVLGRAGAKALADPTIAAAKIAVFMMVKFAGGEFASWRMKGAFVPRQGMSTRLPQVELLVLHVHHRYMGKDLYDCPPSIVAYVNL